MYWWAFGFDATESLFEKYSIYTMIDPLQYENGLGKYTVIDKLRSPHEVSEGPPFIPVKMPTRYFIEEPTI